MSRTRKPGGFGDLSIENSERQRERERERERESIENTFCECMRAKSRVFSHVFVHCTQNAMCKISRVTMCDVT